MEHRKMTDSVTGIMVGDVFYVNDKLLRAFKEDRKEREDVVSLQSYLTWLERKYAEIAPVNSGAK